MVYNRAFILLGKPHMRTINECLHQHMKTVQYVRFLEVVLLVTNASIGAWIFLIDAQDAYYRVHIHPDDWKYMGIEWATNIWCFVVFKWGCQVQRIYTAFANMYVSNITLISHF